MIYFIALIAGCFCVITVAELRSSNYKTLQNKTIKPPPSTRPKSK